MAIEPPYRHVILMDMQDKGLGIVISRGIDGIDHNVLGLMLDALSAIHVLYAEPHGDDLFPLI